jgi:hypothetical protein
MDLTPAQQAFSGICYFVRITYKLSVGSSEWNGPHPGVVGIVPI